MKIKAHTKRTIRISIAFMHIMSIKHLNLTGGFALNKDNGFTHHHKLPNAICVLFFHWLWENIPITKHYITKFDGKLSNNAIPHPPKIDDTQVNPIWRNSANPLMHHSMKAKIHWKTEIFHQLCLAANEIIPEKHIAKLFNKIINSPFDFSE